MPLVTSEAYLASLPWPLWSSIFIFRGARAIAKFISTSKSICHVNLCDNQVGETSNICSHARFELLVLELLQLLCAITEGSSHSTCALTSWRMPAPRLCSRGSESTRCRLPVACGKPPTCRLECRKQFHRKVGYGCILVCTFLKFRKSMLCEFAAHCKHSSSETSSSATR